MLNLIFPCYIARLVFLKFRLRSSFCGKNYTAVEKTCGRFRRQSGEYPTASLHLDEAFVHQHVKRFWVLLAQAGDLYHCDNMHRVDLFEHRDWIQCDSGTV